MNYATIKKDHYEKVNGKWQLIYSQNANLIVDVVHWKDWRKLDLAMGCKSTLSVSNGKMYKYTTINPLATKKVVYTKLID